MIVSELLNITLFVIRAATFAFALILLLNLMADWRQRSQEEKNGLRATRLAMIVIIGALVLENFLYSLAYLHAGFDSVKLNQWLTDARLLLFVARFAILYGVIRLYLLFNHREDK
jgi:hypothetical protein